MTDYRCKNNDLDTLPLAIVSYHECRTILPFSEVLDPMFFSSQHTRLLPGDKLTICRYADKPTGSRSQRPAEMIESRVLESSREGVMLYVTSYFDFSKQSSVDIPELELAAQVPFVPIPKMRWNVGKMGYDIVLDGDVLEHVGKDRAAAEARLAEIAAAQKKAA